MSACLPRATGRNRTRNRSLTKRLLYLLSYNSVLPGLRDSHAAVIFSAGPFPVHRPTGLPGAIRR